MARILSSKLVQCFDTRTYPKWLFRMVSKVAMKMIVGIEKHWKSTGEGLGLFQERNQ
jgi:hypothetical protein